MRAMKKVMGKEAAGTGKLVLGFAGFAEGPNPSIPIPAAPVKTRILNTPGGA